MEFSTEFSVKFPGLQRGLVVLQRCHRVFDLFVIRFFFLLVFQDVISDGPPTQPCFCRPDGYEDEIFAFLFSSSCRYMHYTSDHMLYRHVIHRQRGCFFLVGMRFITS